VSPRLKIDFHFAICHFRVYNVVKDHPLLADALHIALAEPSVFGVFPRRRVWQIHICVSLTFQV